MLRSIECHNEMGKKPATSFHSGSECDLSQPYTELYILSCKYTEMQYIFTSSAKLN